MLLFIGFKKGKGEIQQILPVKHEPDYLILEIKSAPYQPAFLMKIKPLIDFYWQSLLISTAVGKNLIWNCEKDKHYISHLLLKNEKICQFYVKLYLTVGENCSK